MWIASRRVLVVEDSYLIAREVADLLHRLGCTVLGPVRSTTAAFELLHALRTDGIRPDAALLDIHLGDHEAVYPLCQALQLLGVPMLFLTGYDEPAIVERWRKIPRLTKPVDENDLKAALKDAIAKLAPDPAGNPPPGRGYAARATSPADRLLQEATDILREGMEIVRISRNTRMEAQTVIREAKNLQANAAAIAELPRPEQEEPDSG